MSKVKRGVGYCVDPECDEFAKGVFLLNHDGPFCCPTCHLGGKIERERGFYTGNGEVFKEVRVEYNFDALTDTYREVAIVQDVSLWGRNNVYTLQSPLIRTEKRALKIAESILANLNRCPHFASDEDLPSTGEVVLSFDDDLLTLRTKLSDLAHQWETSPLRKL